MAQRLVNCKNNMRKEIKSKLLKITNEEKVLQSSNVADKLYALETFKNSRRISIYLSTDHEVQTTDILRRIFQMNKTCFIPRYDGDTMDMVRLLSLIDYDTLPLTKWKIKQPPIDEARENAFDGGGLDLILVPGVAFTKQGHRLGHGKGYYDRYLRALKATQEHPFTTIGLAFKEQLVDSIPIDGHDVPLDAVLYP